jgi:hypothetical protein
MQLKPFALIQAFYAHELSPQQKAKSRESLRQPLDRAAGRRDGGIGGSAGIERRSSATRVNY